MFGSVGVKDIVTACTQIGATIERSEVRLPDGPFRSVGEFSVVIQLHTDVETELPVNIVAE